MARRSSIKQLPEDLRDLVERLLREDRATQTEILATVNAELDERGKDPISRSAFSRYARRMGESLGRLKQAREVARVWIGELGEEPQGEVGRLAMEVVRTLVFDAAGTLAGADDPAHPKLLQMLARSIRDLEHAAALSADREMKIRRETARTAADALEAAAIDAGVSDDTIQKFRAHILGVAAA